MNRLRKRIASASRAAPESDRPSDWFDEEVPRGKLAWSTVGRLVHRSKATWKVWLSACLLFSAALGFWRIHRPLSYRSTVLLRVSEGAVDVAGTDLRAANLKAFVDSVVFTSDNLLAVMKRHSNFFPLAEADPVTAVLEFRAHIWITISGNDLIEGEPDQDLRSERIAVTVEHTDRNFAWELAKEMADLLINMSLSHEKRALEREEAGAAAAVMGAEGLSLTPEDKLQAADPAIGTQSPWLLKAQRDRATADLGIRALQQGQMLSFRLLDAGDAAAPLSEVQVALTTLVTAMLATSVLLCLFVGAFDPRVLDEEDMRSIGLPVLARFPPIPRGKAPRS